MIKTKKRLLIRWFIAIGCIVLVFILSLVCYQQSAQNRVERLEERWNIELPEKIEYIYHKKTPTSFHGDGIRYHVFQLSAPMDTISDLSSDADKSVEEKIGTALAELEVPDEEKPNFREGYQWKKIKNEQHNIAYLVVDKHSVIYFVEIIK